MGGVQHQGYPGQFNFLAFEEHAVDHHINFVCPAGKVFERLNW